jgi:hypothetical protein
MEIRIPGPTKPRYVEKMRFSFLNPSFIPLGIATGLAPLVTAVGVVMLPLGRPVWNTFVILMCRGDILISQSCNPTRYTDRRLERVLRGRDAASVQKEC